MESRRETRNLLKSVSGTLNSYVAPHYGDTTSEEHDEVQLPRGGCQTSSNSRANKRLEPYRSAVVFSMGGNGRQPMGKTYSRVRVNDLQIVHIKLRLQSCTILGKIRIAFCNGCADYGHGRLSPNNESGVRIRKSIRLHSVIRAKLTPI